MLKSAVRGVEAGYRNQTSCNGMFAIVTVDFEPAAAYGFVDAAPEPVPGRREWMTGETWAEIRHSHAEDLRHYKGVFAETMRVEVGALPVGVLLTRFRHHEVDSSERGFAEAARRAVRELHRLRGPHPPRRTETARTPLGSERSADP